MEDSEFLTRAQGEILRSLCHKKELKFGKISTNYPNVLKTSVRPPPYPVKSLLVITAES